MPITLSVLFTQPQDVWNLLSVEGVDLRMDDHNLASGQIITLSADAAAGSTALSTAALPVALLRGAILVFDGAGMSAPLQAQLTAAAGQGATSLSVAALPGDFNGGAQARDSGVNAATGQRLIEGCRQGTSRVKLYCNQRYDDSQLVLAGSVLDWATVIAARFLCMRRNQGVPKSIQARYDETMDELKMVQLGQLAIEDCATRGVDWPAMSNVTVVPGYDGMRARVQPAISEQTPTVYGQFIDWNSAATIWY